MVTAMRAAKAGQSRDEQSSELPDKTPAAKGLAKMQRAAVQNAPSPRSGGLMGAMMMKKVMMKSKRLRKGFPKRDVDSQGKQMQRILKLNDVIQMASHSDDPQWTDPKDRKLKKRHALIINEFRKGVVHLADDVQFLVRCFDLLDEDGFEELTVEQIVRWVKLLTDPAGVGDGDLLWVQTMGAPLGDKELAKDLVARVGKLPSEQNPRFDWQDFVMITVDFYVLAGSAAMRRTFGELLGADGRPEDSAGSEGHGVSSRMVPQPPKQPKKNATLADDVRARRAAMAAKLGSDLGIANKPPQGKPASGATDGPGATVGSGGGRPAPPEGADVGSNADQEVVVSCSDDTVDLTTEPLDEEKASEDESRVAEVVPQP